MNRLVRAGVKRTTALAIAATATVVVVASLGACSAAGGAGSAGVFDGAGGAGGADLGGGADGGGGADLGGGADGGGADGGGGAVRAGGAGEAPAGSAAHESATGSQISLTPTPTATAVPTASPTPTPHPLAIRWLRERDYPSHDINIKQTLDPGSNYSRYVVSYDSDGFEIDAMLTVPNGEPPAGGWPVIVFNHGYITPSQYRTTERYVAYVDAFASNGYIVLKSDYRGHGDSEGVARGGYGNPDYTVDVLNAVAAIQQFPDADPDRVGMWGHSMGGHITLRSMVATDTVKAGVIWAGVVASYPDLVARWHRRGGPTPGTAPTPAPGATPGGRGRWRGDLYSRFGSPEENPLFWQEVSANSYLRDMSGPIQLHHGTADSSVPYAFSESLQEQMEDAGMESELHAYPGDNHNISASLSLALERSVEFFDEHLKGGE